MSVFIFCSSLCFCFAALFCVAGIAFQWQHTSLGPLVSVMSHIGCSISTLKQSSFMLFWFWQWYVQLIKNLLEHREKHYLVQRSHVTLYLKFCSLRRIKVIKPSSVFFHCISPLWCAGQGLFFDNRSIYLPIFMGLVLTALDESFYKAFCGERRWCLTSLGRMELLRTMV